VYQAISKSSSIGHTGGLDAEYTGRLVAVPQREPVAGSTCGWERSSFTPVFSLGTPFSDTGGRCGLGVFGDTCVCTASEGVCGGEDVCLCTLCVGVCVCACVCRDVCAVVRMCV